MNENSADFSAYRFLIVDDSSQVRLLISSMLKRCQAKEIIQLSDGASAIGYLDGLVGTVDCVICDWNMEPVDGLAVLTAIRSGAIANAQRGIRFIMLTGHGESDVVNAAVNLDASGFLVKPVSMEKLTKTIKTVMSRPVPVKEPEHYRGMQTVTLPKVGGFSRNDRT